MSAHARLGEVVRRLGALAKDAPAPPAVTKLDVGVASSDALAALEGLTASLETTTAHILLDRLAGLADRLARAAGVPPAAAGAAAAPPAVADLDNDPRKKQLETLVQHVRRRA